MNSVEVDTEAVLQMFGELDKKHRRRVFRNTMNEGGRKLVNATKRNLRNVQTASGKLNTKSKNKWNGKTLEQGVKYRTNRDNTSVTVNILNDFRLKFFEMGTSDRYAGARYRGGKYRQQRGTRKAFRGRIREYRFFEQAIKEEAPKISKSFQETAVKHVNRVNQKYRSK